MRLLLLFTTTLLILAAPLPASGPRPFDSAQRAALHSIVHDGPAVDFFSGGILGNGSMGAIVTTRPDGVMIHFGHNAVWDQRAQGIPMEKLGTFADLWQRSKKGDHSWRKAYNKMASEPDQKPYPRPWPCGSLLLTFDRRDAELLGHTVHLDTGVMEVRILAANGAVQRLEIFADMEHDRLWLRMVDASGAEIEAPFRRIELRAKDGMPVTRAESENALSFRQELPTLTPDPERNRALRLTVRVGGRILKTGPKAPYQLTPANLRQDGPFRACVQLDQGLAKDVPQGVAGDPQASVLAWRNAARSGAAVWRGYWERSGVMLDDSYLESVWYRNLYFFNCVSRPGTKCPGLWGNWSLDGIGTAWHGEYVLDYNAQQSFWAAFSSNHVENNLPYVDMVEQISVVGRRWARGFYGLPGVFFGQIMWPVETPSIPVPGWTWNNILSPTPWTVEGLWWHYLYTMDKAFLRERAFGPIKEATEFMNGFMRLAQNHGPSSPWNDGKFHIYPSTSPEIWNDEFGKPGFSGDGIVDLALTKFLFRAYLQACEALGIVERERSLMDQVREILANYPEYATSVSPRGGTVFLDVADASPDAIYNVPNTLITVFPGEEHGLHSPAAIRELAANTWRNLQNEGGNELVFLNLQGARLGLLDLGKFKRQLRYCEMPDGTFADLVLQTDGRYDEKTKFDYMARMGIWVENFALPAVINESLLQSYNGELRFFPNWRRADGNARFQTLRAAGAFLVSAELKDGRVEWIQALSEKGGRLRMINPWPGQALVRRDGSGPLEMAGAHIELETKPGESFIITAAR
jgi:alpha-L-fucosidase 2